MSRKWSIINFIVTFAVTVLSLLLIVKLCNDRRGNADAFAIIALYVVGAIVAGIFTTFMHELGHLIFGKKNGFAILSFSVLFFKWIKEKNGTSFRFTLPSDEAGSVELVAKHTENLEKRYKRMSFGGIFFTFVTLLISVVPFIFVDELPVLWFAALSMLMPVSLYCLVENAIPMTSGGFSNDGAVMHEIRKSTDGIKVVMNLLRIQSEMYNGKTPSEIDESLYFDLPQLPEDDLNFTLLLNARYNYYLDLNDLENAKIVADRLASLEEYMPKGIAVVVKADELYNRCTFNYDEQKADDLMYELDKYLNNVNTATNVRIKLAYILNVRHESDKLELFYKKGLKEASKCQIKGQGLFEKKLLKQLKAQTEEVCKRVTSD